jgi:uncharacterized protein
LDEHLEVEGTVFDQLLPGVLRFATEAAKRSVLHGPDHWRTVARNGKQLCEATHGADPYVVTLFAALHDACRNSDGWDPDHGRRAAVLAGQLRGVYFEITDGQLRLLDYALRLHTDGFVVEDPTVGCCWDADRLDLPRCGIKPDSRYLSTAAAKELLGDQLR